MKKYNVAVVGATGMVGRKFLQVLEERRLPVNEYFLFASAKSAGKKVSFRPVRAQARHLLPFSPRKVPLLSITAANGGWTQMFPWLCLK